MKKESLYRLKQNQKMATELKVENLAGMKMAEYVNAFKGNKNDWKKAKFVLLMTDFKFSAGKFTVALPFKKIGDVKFAFQRVKTDKIHKPAKVGIGKIFFEKADGGRLAKIELVKGGLKAEMAKAKAEKIFQKIKCAVDFVTKDKAKGEPTSTEKQSPKDQPISKSTPESPQSEQAQTDKPNPKAQVEELKKLAKNVLPKLPKIKAEFVPAIKTRKLTDAQQQEISNLLADSKSFLSTLEASPTKVQEAFGKYKMKMVKGKLQLEQLTAAIAKIGSKPKQSKTEKAKKKLAAIRARIAKIKAQLAS